MPITQERFMQIVTGAKRLMLFQQALKEVMLRDLSADISVANSVIAQTEDTDAIKAIKNMLGRIDAMRQAFFELQDADTEMLMAIILAEDIHFTRVKRRNQKAKYYQEQARRDRGAIQRGPEPEIKGPNIAERSVPITEPEHDIANSPKYQAFLNSPATQKVYANWNASANKDESKAQTISANKSPNAEATALKIAEERAENEAIFGPLDMDSAAAHELELMRLAKLGLRPTSYDPKVIATSAPTQDELNELPTKSGEDLL